MITPVLLTVAVLLALLWLLGVGVECIWDQVRYAEMAKECKSAPFRFEYAYRIERQALDEKINNGSIPLSLPAYMALAIAEILNEP